MGQATETKVQYLDESGKLHREDGPAIERTDGSKEWRRNGVLHREDGPAIELSDGSKVWYLNGECHREDGPAIEYPNGYKAWFKNDELHREDGPAIEHPDGTKEYFLFNHRIERFYKLPFDYEWDGSLSLEENFKAVLKLFNAKDG